MPTLDKKNLDSKKIDGISAGISEILNSVLADYVVDTGQTIEANDIVQLINDKVNNPNYDVESNTSFNFSANVVDCISATKLDSSKVLVAYRDTSDSKGKAIVLSISGTVITKGTEFEFNANSVTYMSATTLDSGKALVVYYNPSNSSMCSTVLSVSGTTITKGVELVIDTTGSARTLCVSALSSTKAIVAYADYSNSEYGQAIILSISVTTITKGTVIEFNSATTGSISVSALSETKVIVAYDNSAGTAIVLSISGTTITKGTAFVFNSSSYISGSSSVALDATKVLVAYNDFTSTDYGKVIVLSISDTTITKGTAVTFFSANVSYIATALIDSTKVLLAYKNPTTSGLDTAILKIVGTVISIGNIEIIDTSNPSYIAVTTIDSKKILITYRETTGKSEVLTPSAIVNGISTKAGTAGNTIPIWAW